MYHPHGPVALFVLVVLGAVGGQIPVVVAVIVSALSVSFAVVSFLLRSLLHARYWR